jgi:hypothetical protein
VSTRTATARALGGQRTHDQRDFESHHDEHEAVEQKGERVPDGASGQARVGAHDL